MPRCDQYELMVNEDVTEYLPVRCGNYARAKIRVDGNWSWACDEHVKNLGNKVEVTKETD